MGGRVSRNSVLSFPFAAAALIAMTQPDTPAPMLHTFHASRDSQVAGLQRWALGGAVVGLAGLGWLAKPAVFWSGGAILLLVCGALWRMARRLLQPGRPVFTLTPTHLETPLLREFGGRLAWDELAAADLRIYQKAVSLILTLRHGDSSRNFWTGLQRNQRLVALTMLNEAEQARLLALVRARLPREVPAGIDELQVEADFQARLKALAPMPWLTWTLVAANGLIWSLTDFAEFGLKPATAEQLLLWGANAASEVQRGEWWRLFTAIFLHGDLIHLVMNMVGLLAAGVMVERIYGRGLYALIYVGAGLCGSALSLHFAAQSAVSVGASGAVFGVTGALLVAVLQHRDRLPSSFGRDTVTGLSFFILYALVQGLSKDGVDNAAHVGGLLGGALLAWLLPERFDPGHYRRTWRRGAAMALAATLVLVAGISLTAPAARVDQQKRMQVQRDFVAAAQAFDAAMADLRQENEEIRAGRRTLQESDARSRTVHAPAFRRVAALFEQARVEADHPRHALYQDLRRMSALLAESLAMESVHREGLDEPQPADPVRMEQIHQELRVLAERLKQDAGR